MEHPTFDRFSRLVLRLTTVKEICSARRFSGKYTTYVQHLEPVRTGHYLTHNVRLNNAYHYMTTNGFHRRNDTKFR